MTEKRGKIVIAIFFFAFVSVLVVFSWLSLQSWKAHSRNEAIRKELRFIKDILQTYVNENENLYPPDLSFLSDDEWEWVSKRNANKVAVDISRIEYVWIGNKRYLFSDCFLPPERTEALRRFYGEFDYHKGRLGAQTRQGMPNHQVIVYLYDEDLVGESNTYFVFLDDTVRILPREQAHETVVLQNAFLRLPLDESDINILLKGLENRNSGFRFRSAEALAKLGRPEGREFLDSQFQSEDIYLKLRAADALARLGEQTAVDLLQATAEDSDDKYMRVFAEVTLREIGKWQPTQMQYYTDQEWKERENWGEDPLPLFEEDIEGFIKYDPTGNPSPWLEKRK